MMQHTVIDNTNKVLFQCSMIARRLENFTNALIGFPNEASESKDVIDRPSNGILNDLECNSLAAEKELHTMLDNLSRLEQAFGIKTEIPESSDYPRATTKGLRKT